MIKKTMNIKKTKQALNGYFQTQQEGQNVINEIYLNDSIYLLLMNTESLYNKLKNKRIKIDSLIWETFSSLANDILNNEFYNEGFIVSSSHLKSWLKDYGKSYEIFENLKHMLETERFELLNQV